MKDGQYSLDADPMLLAKRVQTLEHAVDLLARGVAELVQSERLICYETEMALCEDKPLQAQQLADEHERINRIHDIVHAAGVLMGRSWA